MRNPVFGDWTYRIRRFGLVHWLCLSYKCNTLPIGGSHYFLAKLISASNEPDVADSQTHALAHIAQQGMECWDFFLWTAVGISSGGRKSNIVTADKRERQEEQTDNPPDCPQTLLSCSHQEATGTSYGLAKSSCASAQVIDPKVFQAVFSWQDHSHYWSSKHVSCLSNIWVDNLVLSHFSSTWELSFVPLHIVIFLFFCKKNTIAEKKKVGVHKNITASYIF